jgi:hypothetical protein
LIKLVAAYSREIWYAYDLDVTVNNGGWN